MGLNSIFNRYHSAWLRYKGVGWPMHHWQAPIPNRDFGQRDSADVHGSFSLRVLREPAKGRIADQQWTLDHVHA